MATDRFPAEGFSLTDPPVGFIDDPYPVYAALREQAPVHELTPGSLLLTRHADVAAIYRSADVSSDKQREFGPKLGVGTPIFEHHTTSLVFNDPPLHTRVRRLLMGALNQRAIARMEPGLVALVDGLLDRLADEPAPDLIEHFAARDPGRRDRQPAGHPVGRARAAARLVAGHPVGAGAGARRRACWRAPMPRRPTSSPTCAAWSPSAARTRATPRPTC